MAQKVGHGTVFANGTFVITAQAAILNKLLPVGTNTSVIEVYDASAATTAAVIWSQRRYLKTMASADVELNLPLMKGITVVVTSVVGTTVLTWSKV